LLERIIPASSVGEWAGLFMDVWFWTSDEAGFYLLSHIDQSQNCPYLPAAPEEFFHSYGHVRSGFELMSGGYGRISKFSEKLLLFYGFWSIIK
jgi:hypothetical protein